MSSRREVLIRIALLRRKTLIETKYHLPFFFFVPNSGDLTAQESPPPGICHPRQKKVARQPELDFLRSWTVILPKFSEKPSLYE